MEQETTHSDGTKHEVADTLLRRFVVEAAGQGAGTPGARGKSDPRHAGLLLKDYRKASEKERAFEVDMWRQVIDIKMHGDKVIADYRARGLGPPDLLPHPHHFNVSEDGDFSIDGPITHDARRNWELLKYYIKSAAQQMAYLRKELAADPENEFLQRALEDYRKLRRKLMDQVPEGWSWRENIETPDNTPRALIAAIKKVANVKLDKDYLDALMEMIEGDLKTNWGINASVAPKRGASREPKA